MNCAAIPQGLAERLLFARGVGPIPGPMLDAEGFIQRRPPGRCFDEGRRSDLSVQAKLLRVLETRSFCRWGGALANDRASVCSATNKDLKSQVAAGRFAKTRTTHRSPGDLDSAAAQSGPEEITWLVDAVARDASSTARRCTSR